MLILLGGQVSIKPAGKAWHLPGRWYPLLKKLLWISLGLFVVAAFTTQTAGCRLMLADSAPEEAQLTKIRVSRVVDGDTVYVRFSCGVEEKLRLIGVDAPEINHPVKGIEPFGTEADHYARSALEDITAWLEFDEGERDQYGRLLAYLWLDKPVRFDEGEIREKMFNARLLLDGYAVQVIFEPNVRYVDYFSLFEAEARKNKRGLWGLE